MCLVTQQGLLDIRATRDYHSRKLHDLRSQLAGTEVKIPQQGDGGGSTDNDHLGLMLEIASTEQLMLQQEELLRKAVVVKPPADNSIADIDTVITIRRYNKDQVIIGEETYLIGGHEATDLKTTPWPTLGYNAPIMKSIFKKPVDPERDHGEVHIAGKKFFIELVKIELPGKLVPLRQAS